MHKKTFLLVIISLLLLTACLVYAADNDTASGAIISESADLTINNVLFQIKSTVKDGYSPSKIESWIADGKKIGVKAYRLDRYGKNIGWSVLDSKNRVVVSAIFQIKNNKAISGKYYGALFDQKNAEEVHKKHIKLLNAYYTNISNSIYNVGNNCTAIASLFTGSTGLGRTIIDIECH